MFWLELCGWVSVVLAGWFLVAVPVALLVARHLGRREHDSDT